MWILGLWSSARFKFLRHEDLAPHRRRSWHVMTVKVGKSSHPVSVCNRCRESGGRHARPVISVATAIEARFAGLIDGFPRIQLCPGLLGGGEAVNTGGRLPMVCGQEHPFQLTIRPTSVVSGSIESTRWRSPGKLDTIIRLLSVAKDACRVAPAKISFWFACILLTMNQGALSSLPRRASDSRFFRTQWTTNRILSILDCSTLMCVKHLTGGFDGSGSGKLSESVQGIIEQLTT